MIKIIEPQITQEDIDAVIKCLESKQISGRSHICKEFEEEFAKKFESNHAIAVNSGTSALFLALKSLGIGKGDEVIIPNFAFIAVANAVSHTGATPRFVEVEKNTFNIDPSLISINHKTKAIIAVHTFGKPCDMEKLMDFGIPVIEDAAEAHGAKYKGRIVGSIGTIGCFSFFANKTMTTGEGGMVVTNDDSLAREIRLLKDQYNGNIRFKHDKIGFGMSLGAMQCALGLSQLKRLEHMVNEKRRIASVYFKGLSDIQEITLPDQEKDFHSFWMFPIIANNKLKDFLSANNIEVRGGFFPIHRQPPYDKTNYLEKENLFTLVDVDFPVSEFLYDNLICLPMNIDMSYSDQLRVINSIREFYTYQK